MPVVIVPPPLQGPTAGVGRVEVAAETVRGTLERMEGDYPGFGELVLEANGELSSFVKIFRNGEQVDPGSLDQEVAAADELEVVTAIAGG